MKRISLIVPCLNEEEAIPAFKQEIDRVFKECLEGYAPELIFVDDGSTDRSLEMIKKMAEHSPEVKFISFSRNFGKEAAIYAGLEAATGDYAAVTTETRVYLSIDETMTEDDNGDDWQGVFTRNAVAVLFRPRLL